MRRRLSVFISSTSDLDKERGAVEKALSELNIDGSRFEYWPSTPNEPISECLEQIEQCEALVLLLGARYGCQCQNGISVTHMEYRHARKLNRLVYAYVLQCEQREVKQVNFIKEVEKEIFRCQLVKSIKQLKIEVKNSFLSEFTKCFKKVHSSPPESVPVDHNRSAFLSDYPPINSSKEAFELLNHLYNIGDELGIQKVAQIHGDKFDNIPEIANFIYMADVNLAMDGVEIEPQRIIEAIVFWDSPDALQRWHIASLHYNQGNAFSSLKRYKKAIELYKKSIQEDPNYAFCWKNLGDAYRETTEITLARQCYEKALNADPQLFEALYSYATLLISHENDNELALCYLNKILPEKLSKAHLSAVYAWKAIACLNIGLYEEGISSAEYSINTYPDTDFNWKTAGRLYALVRQQDNKWLFKCADFWERFLLKFPHVAEAWAELGFVHWFINNTGQLQAAEQSLAAFEKSLKLGFEDDGLAWDRLGHLYEGKNNYQQAEICYRNAVKLSTKDFGYCLGVCLMSQKKHQEGLPYLLAAATRYQPDGLSWTNVGVCQAEIGNIDDAITSYKKAISLDGDSEIAWFNLGGLYWNKREVQRAIEVWGAAVSRFPDNELCNQVYEILGHFGLLKGLNQDTLEN